MVRWLTFDILKSPHLALVTILAFKNNDQTINLIITPYGFGHKY
jgi:hypothetical protein